MKCRDKHRIVVDVEYIRTDSSSPQTAGLIEYIRRSVTINGRLLYSDCTTPGHYTNANWALRYFEDWVVERERELLPQTPPPVHVPRLIGWIQSLCRRIRKILK